MNNLFLLDALLQLIYWLIEMAIALLKVFLIPFSILHAGFTLTPTETLEYSKQLISLRWNKLKTFGLSFKLIVDHQKPHLTVHSYDEDAQEASKRITETSHTTVHARIAKGLEEARKYLYVIFQTNETGITFIQLRSDTGIYLFDFPLTPRSLNRDYAIDIIDYLQSRGFTKTKPGLTYKDKTYCIDGIDDELTTIQANLGSDKAFVADFCTRIFKNIFHTSHVPEVIFG